MISILASAKVTTLDIVVTITYMVLIVGAGCWVGIRHRRKSGTGEAREYFLAGSTLSWPMIGMALYAKRLERGRFLWPSPADGTVAISAAQLGYLLSGIDWRNPQESWRPTSVG